MRSVPASATFHAMGTASSLCRGLVRALARVPGGRFVTDVVDAAVVLREVEEARWTEGPARLVARMKARGMRTEPRSPAERRHVERVLYRLDRLMHGETNCYRRSLARVALDRDAATEPFVLGLDLPATGPDGHAWVEGTADGGRTFDVEFRV